MFKIKVWEIQIALGIVIILGSFYYFLTNQVHTGLEVFGIGLIPIALTLIGPTSIIQHMKQTTNQQEIEEIDLEWDT